MRSLNQVNLIGNLTRDPEVTVAVNGKNRAVFTVATDRTWVNSAGEKKAEAEFHRVVAWDKLADIVEMILTKGRRVFIQGRLTTRKFTDAAGLDKYLTEIVANDMIAVDNRKLDTEEAPKVEEEVVAKPATAEVTTADIPF